MIEIVPATRTHAACLGFSMRDADKDEAHALGMTPFAALMHSLDASTEAHTALKANRPIVMWGVAPRSLLSDCATLWMLGAPDLDRHPRQLLRASKAFVDHAQSRYPVVEAWVVKGYAKTVRWLLWLGFTLEERVQLNTGREFHIFRRRQEWAPQPSPSR